MPHRSPEMQLTHEGRLEEVIGKKDFPSQLLSSSDIWAKVLECSLLFDTICSPLLRPTGATSSP
jgi:hypothetical protein